MVSSTDGTPLRSSTYRQTCWVSTTDDSTCGTSVGRCRTNSTDYSDRSSSTYQAQTDCSSSTCRTQQTIRVRYPHRWQKVQHEPEEPILPIIRISDLMPKHFRQIEKILPSSQTYKKPIKKH